MQQHKQEILSTLKMTFPNKDNDELMRIGLQHFQGLMDVILLANNLIKKGSGDEKKDFQNSQPEGNS